MQSSQVRSTSANVIHNEHGVFLQSYSTIVAANINGVDYVTNQSYSVTTSRHLNEWLGYKWQDADNKISSEELDKMYRGGGEKKEDSGLGTVAMVAMMGNVFCKGQKAQNDWKERMIRAGLEGRGLIMPDDWDSLDENEKQRRLDGVITELAKA